MAAGAFGRARDYGWDSPFEYLVIGVSCCSHPATEWVCIRKVNIVATVCCIVLLVLLVFISIITLAVRMRYTILKLSYKNIYKNICKNGNVSLFVCTPFCWLFLSRGLNANKVPCRFTDLDYKFLIQLHVFYLYWAMKTYYGASWGFLAKVNLRWLRILFAPGIQRW